MSTSAQSPNTAQSHVRDIVPQDIPSKQWIDPEDLASQLIQEGWPVPAFLLYPSHPSHIRPHVALATLGNMLEALGHPPEPYVYYPPDDTRHVPPHIVAMERQRKLWELQHLHPRPRSQTTARRIALFKRIWLPFQYLIGTALGLSGLVITLRGIFEGYSKMGIHPAGVFIIFVALLVVIAYAEGYHVTIITLEKADSNVFKLSHPRAYTAHCLANKNAECFLVGRQVLLTFVVFGVANVTQFKKAGFEDGWLFYPRKFIEVFMESGVGVSLIVLAFGQLLPQLIAATYPVHHYGLPGGTLLIRLMLLVDRIGFADVGFWAAYGWRKYRGILINEEFGVGGEVVFGVHGEATQSAVAHKDLTPDLAAPGTHTKPGEDAIGEIRKRVQYKPLQLAKLAMSVSIMLGFTGYSIYNIIQGESTLKAPWPVLVLVFAILLVAMTYLEGMNLCVLALEKVPNDHIMLINPGAAASHKLIIGDNGDNVKRFLLGRQFCVVWTDFLINNIAGLWSVAITVFIAQVMSQIIAATNPAYWMALPGARFMLILSLTIERLGVCHFGWLLGKTSQFIGEKMGLLQPEPFSVGRKVSISTTSATSLREIS